MSGNEVTGNIVSHNVLFRVIIVCLLTTWTALLPGGGCVKNVCDSDSDCVAGARCAPATSRCVLIDAGDAGDAVADAGDAGDAGDASDAEPECTQPAQCTDPTEPICDATDLACRGCQADPECLTRDPALPVYAAPACVQCTDSAAHCTNPAPLCEPTTQQCRACADHAECAARDPSAPACDGASCVECTDSALHCSGTAPICEPTTDACRSCASHAECALAGGVCDWATGACLAEPAVIYADDDTCPGMGDGSRADPYCSLQDAVDAVTAGRTTILVADGTYEPIVVENLEAWIIGQGGGATISPLILDEHVVTARSVNLSDVTTLTLENLIIQNGSNTGAGVFCSGLAAAQPDLVLNGNTITGNAGGGVAATSCNATLNGNTITGNAGGGVSLSLSDFTLTNNIVAQNGGTSPTFGGVYISAPGATAEVWHNTIVNNLTVGASAAGIRCIDPVSIVSTIAHGNLNADLSPSCNASFSWTTADGDPQLDGAYHLQPGSGCIDGGDPAGTLDHDLDGDLRPQGGGPDIGADEAQ